MAEVTPRDRIEEAFRRLRERPGFVDRPDQRQLSLLIGDMLGEGETGVFEAPTGLGKSLAALLPALAHARDGKRVVVATYTNVLAEQYWSKDVPLARSLFEEPAQVEFLIGRSRYACRLAAEELDPMLLREMEPMRLGIETEFRGLIRPAKRAGELWKKVAVPPVCPGRACPHYETCWYYEGRRRAVTAPVVITNHALVIQDALMAGEGDEGEGPLGRYDFLIVDEAHDLFGAAQNGLEFELSGARLSAMAAIATRLEYSVMPLASRLGDEIAWRRDMDTFRKHLDDHARTLDRFSESGVLDASPAEVRDSPAIRSMLQNDRLEEARTLAGMVAKLCETFERAVDRRLEKYKMQSPDDARGVLEGVRNYRMYLHEFASGSRTLFTPEGVSVSHAGLADGAPRLRRDVVDVAGPLRPLLWDKRPWACLSATLAVDGGFDFYERLVGAKGSYEEVLPSPFDHAIQTAIYLPPEGTIPDPGVARREGMEDLYWQAMARQLSMIIRRMGGRTLGLFHSRKEMEGVARHMDLPEGLPLLVQGRTGTAAAGERFKRNPEASLFGLRSFWTGFDAPGETLSCVAIARVPFEVPVDPPQVARMAWLASLGEDPFAAHTLPMAKMTMRQGAGRLIRDAADRGVVALLDPRLRTKPWGEEILTNLPETTVFPDLLEAMAHVGLESAELTDG